MRRINKFVLMILMGWKELMSMIHKRPLEIVYYDTMTNIWLIFR